MLTEVLRARLATLNRGAAGNWPAAPAKRYDGSPAVVSGQEVLGPQGTCYRVRRRVVEIGATSLSELLGLHETLAAEWVAAQPELDCFVRAFPRRTLFLDLETCGWSGAPLFLVGLLRQLDGELVVEQLLARDYAEEPAVLERLWGLLSDFEVLVTFNGKTFDWPFVVDRSTVHRIPGHHSGERSRSTAFRCPLVHLDLLSLARRYWKEPLVLPNCRLQTLESALCRRHRSGDIPGWQVPAAYHAFVRSGDTSQLNKIISHNALDLLTLAELSLLLVRDLAADDRLIRTFFA